MMSYPSDCQHKQNQDKIGLTWFWLCIVFICLIISGSIQFEGFFLENKLFARVLRLIVIPFCFLVPGLLFLRKLDLSALRVSDRQFLSAVALSALLLGILLLLKSLKYINLNYELFDLGLYYQQLQTLNLTSDTMDKVLLALRGHFHPSLLVFAWIEKIFGFFAVMTFQTCFIASSLYPLYKLAEKHLKNHVLQVFIIFAFATSPVIHFLDILGFHPDHVFLPSLLWLCYFLNKNNKILFYIFVIIAISAGEQWMPTLVAFLIFYKPHKEMLLHARGTACAVSIIFVCYLLSKIYGQQAYSIFHQPSNVEDFVFDPSLWVKKIFFAFWVLGAFLPAIALNYRISAALSPFFLKLLVVSEEYHFSIEGHYTYDVMAVLFVLLATAPLHNLSPKFKRVFGFYVCLLPFYFVGQSLGHGVMPYSVNFYTQYSASTFNYQNYLPNEDKRQLVKMNMWLSQNDKLMVGVTNDAFVPDFANRQNFGLINQHDIFDVLVLSQDMNQSFGSKANEAANRDWLVNFKGLLSSRGFEKVYSSLNYDIFTTSRVKEIFVEQSN